MYLSKAEGTIGIPTINQRVDPMHYLLLYPLGGFGWMPNMKSNIQNCNISVLQFYSYKLSIRDELHLGKLIQQYVVDAWVKVESS